MDQLESDTPITPPTAPDPHIAVWRAEAAVIFTVGVMVPCVGSLVSFLWYDNATPHALSDAAMSICYSLATISVALFIMWRSDEPPAAFGFCRPMWGADIVLCLIALLVAWMAQYTYGMLVYNLVPVWAEAPAYEFAYPKTVVERVLMSIAMILNGASEEIVLWAVLFTRLERLMKGAVVPVILVAGMFASYHLYQGVSAVGSIFLVGLVHGLVFAVTRRILPLIAAHAIVDIWLIMVVPQ